MSANSELSPSQALWLQVGRELLYWDRYHEHWRASEAAFRNPLPDGQKLGVTIPSPVTLQAGPDAFLEQRSGVSAVAEFTVQDARDVRQAVMRDPGDLEQGFVVGPKPRGVRLLLAERSVIRPECPG